MSHYEYAVFPAPHEAPRVKGLKGTEARFAHAFVEILNRQGRDGWEFQRSETMTAEARSGFFGRHRSEVVTVLIFRRWIETAMSGGSDVSRTEPTASYADDVPAGQPAEPRSGRLTAARGTGPELGLRPVPGPGRS